MCLIWSTCDIQRTLTWQLQHWMPLNSALVVQDVDIEELAHPNSSQPEGTLNTIQASLYYSSLSNYLKDSPNSLHKAQSIESHCFPFLWIFTDLYIYYAHLVHTLLNSNSSASAMIIVTSIWIMTLLIGLVTTVLFFSYFFLKNPRLLWLIYMVVHALWNTDANCGVFLFLNY